jgi:hypothetical protein
MILSIRYNLFPLWPKGHLPGEGELAPLYVLQYLHQYYTNLNWNKSSPPLNLHQILTIETNNEYVCG